MGIKSGMNRFLILTLTVLLLVAVIFAEPVYAAGFSEEEQQYIQQKQELKVAFVEHSTLFSRNKETGSYSGLAFEILQRLRNKTGLKIIYTEAESYREAVKMTEDGETDITAVIVEYPYTKNTYLLEETEPYLKAGMAIVRQKSTDLKNEDEYSVAEVNGYPVFSNNPMLIHTKFDSLSDCLAAVQGGQADILYCNIYAAMSYVQRYRSRDMVAFPVNAQMWFKFGVSSEEDAVLKNMLNQIVLDMTRQETNEILTRQVDNNGSGFKDFVYHYPFEIICFILISAFLTALIAILHVLTRSRYKISAHGYDESYRLLADFAGGAGFKYEYMSDTMSVFGTYAYKLAQPPEIRNFRSYLGGEDSAVSLTKEQFDQMLADGMDKKAHGIKLKFQMIDGTWRHFQVVFSIVTTEAAYRRPICMTGFLTDMEDEYQEKEELVRLGLYDSITMLYNRYGAECEIEKRCQSQEAIKNDVILMMDVDNFKTFNDVYGHKCGDDVLKTIGQHMKSIFGKDDIICRWGGDEFMLYIADAADHLETIIKWCETLGNVMKEYRYQEQCIPVTCSIGGAVVGERSPEETFLAADKALYQIKQSKKGSIHIEG